VFLWLRHPSLFCLKQSVEITLFYYLKTHSDNVCACGFCSNKPRGAERPRQDIWSFVVLRSVRSRWLWLEYKEGNLNLKKTLQEWEDQPSLWFTAHQFIFMNDWRDFCSGGCLSPVSCLVSLLPVWEVVGMRLLHWEGGGVTERCWQSGCGWFSHTHTWGTHTHTCCHSITSSQIQYAWRQFVPPGCEDIFAGDLVSSLFLSSLVSRRKRRSDPGFDWRHQMKPDPRAGTKAFKTWDNSIISGGM